MVKYICEKCGKEFTQKGHYTTHINKKNPCVYENNLLHVNEIVHTPSTSISNVVQVRNQGLDKFYTIPMYAKHCIDTVFQLYNKDSFDMIIEPSAGNGSFFNQIHHSNLVGIDIAPESNNIHKQDFFSYLPPSESTNILVVGNPPFGRVSSLAIQFFNHAAQFCSTIAFIIPKTFRRISVQNKLNTSFHIVYDEDVPDKPCSFYPKMSVKCCFQIWEKRDTLREIITLDTKHPDWTFLPYGPKDVNNQPTPPEGADFAMRAYGGKIGQIVTENLQDLRPKSWHWIKATTNKNELIHLFSLLDYSNSTNTARQNSMGRGELVSLYSNFIDSIPK
jgi:hypothetical protein